MPVVIPGLQTVLYAQDGTAAAPLVTFGADTDTGWYRPSANTIGVTVAGAEIARWTSDGALFIGDTASARMTRGLLINQGANDDQALAFKSSDVSHGMTTAAEGADLEVDDFFAIGKTDGNGGGAVLQSVMENAGHVVAAAWEVYGGQAQNTHTSSGRGLFEFSISQHNGSNALSAITADGNVFVIRGNQGGSMRSLFILDEDGDLFVDGSTTITAFDDHDDRVLLRDARMAIVNSGPNVVKQNFGEFIKYHRDALSKLDIVHFDDRGSPTVNITKLLYLACDTIDQVSKQADKRFERLEQRLLEAGV